MRRIFILLVLALLAVDAAAQQYPERRQVRKGNRAYEKGNYQDAAGRYMRALSADPSSFEAQYNLGNALHRQEMYDQAAQVQQQAAADSLAAPSIVRRPSTIWATRSSGSRNTPKRSKATRTRCA